ncbi:hypothetical protein QBC32DRAFT_314408 [Pseudoneurospora amorphoporcata]|uniref:Uncharacterized protein n=1 Tax=Pseudoneurospora amorphoporcata TaxID=241081 RepID=A0AAN6NU75_9PEZI|nr:hypothetical protein QBC32DRAFT_314408 [Pseudoneurospora amorphoporcata]
MSTGLFGILQLTSLLANKPRAKKRTQHQFDFNTKHLNLNCVLGQQQTPFDISRVFLSSIPPSSTFYLNFEGKSLSRNGILSLLTVLVLPTQATSNVDVQTLGDSAFTTPGIGGNTLKAILEDPHIF